MRIRPTLAAVALLAASLAPMQATFKPVVGDTLSDQDVSDAYIYLLGRLLVLNQEQRANWLPAPQGDFSLYMRAYWPESAVTDGDWTPPAVKRKP